MGANDRSSQVKMDFDAIRSGVLTICSNNGIATTDAAWATFINGRTDAQTAALVRQFFIALINFRADGSG